MWIDPTWILRTLLLKVVYFDRLVWFVQNFHYTELSFPMPPFAFCPLYSRTQHAGFVMNPPLSYKLGTTYVYTFSRFNIAAMINHCRSQTVLRNNDFFCYWNYFLGSSVFFPFLGKVDYLFGLSIKLLRAAWYPDVSLARVKEGGKETTGEKSLRPPSVPFPWSLAVHHQSFLYLAKNEAPEEEAVLRVYWVECCWDWRSV